MAFVPSVLNFSTFLNEAESSDGVEISILSGTAKPSPTSKSFMAEFENRGIVCSVVDINNMTLEKIYNGYIV